MPRPLPWSLTGVSDPEASRRRVMYGLRSYVRARSDVARMEVADLSVLPHQEIALAHAVELLEQEWDGLAMAAAAVLTEQPAMLVGGASGETGCSWHFWLRPRHTVIKADAELMTPIVTKPSVFLSALRGSGPARPRAGAESDGRATFSRPALFALRWSQGCEVVLPLRATLPAACGEGG